MLIGIILLLIGMFMIFVGSFLGSKSKVEAAGIISIGPFPIFGAFTNKNIFYLLIGITIVIFIIFILLKKIVL